MNDRYDVGYGDGGDDPYGLVGYDEYGRPVYRQDDAWAPGRDIPEIPQQSYDPYPPQGPQDRYGQQEQQHTRHEQRGHGGGYGQDPYVTGDPRQPPASYDSYDTYDSYGAGPGSGQQPQAASYASYDSPGTQGGHHTPEGAGTVTPDGPHGRSHDDFPYGRSAQGGIGPWPRGTEQPARIPQQPGPADGETGLRGGDGRGDRPAAADFEGPEHNDHAEQFAFVEEPDEASEDVIDWLQFTENRSERRGEAKRRARSRIVALVVVLALVTAGGVGFLWYTGRLPGVSGSDGDTAPTTAGGAQQRDVIVVHLHDTEQGGTATALLVGNTTAKRGSTVLLPNSLALSAEDGTTTTLAKSVEDDGSGGTRSALDVALGTDIEGTWRLDTPYLRVLVDLVGNIDVDTDADVPDPDAEEGEALLVKKGDRQTLTGKMAVAYATHRASGEAQNAQLERFGQVMRGVLRKMTSDAGAATTTVQTLGQIIEPPLTDSDLGSFLARLAELAKGGDHSTTLLPVEEDGTLTEGTGDSVVKEVLGGSAKSPDQDAAVSVSVRDGTGVEDNAEKARVVLLNGGFTFLGGGTVTASASSEVVYADEADAENASEVAKTLGLPTESVTRGEVAGNARVSVVLGQDYDPGS